jgi:hypothetical protein
MNPSKLFLTLGVAAALSLRAGAAISVTGAGAGPFDFSTAPTAADFSTLSIAGGSADLEAVAAMDAAVVTNAASTVVTALPTAATVPPNADALARHNTTGLFLQTRPTGNAYTLMMATLVNAAGGTITSFTLAYDFKPNNAPTATPAEAIPGQRVFFSVTGAPGSWQLVPALSGLTVDVLGASATISGISWPAGANAYILWADDNSQPNEDWGNTIDNLAITGVTTIIEPTTIVITSPTSGQNVAVCADLTVSTMTTGPITNVDFLLDGVFVANDTTFPFGGTVMVPAATPLGPHTLTAVATDTTGAMVATAPRSFNVVANTPPMIALTNTFSGTVTGTTFLVGSPITVQAGFSDDDVITNISWFVDGVLYITNRINNTWTYVDSLAGTHVLRGEASDRKGQVTAATRTITVTNPPASTYTLLVTNGSEWRYTVASTAEPPLSFNQPWYSTIYDDSGLLEWASGFAELGNGDVVDGHPERTMIDIGPAGARYSAIYFRKIFDVTDPSAFAIISLRLLRDDGAVVYLNGLPVWTNNIAVTTSPIVYTNFANASDDGLNYQVLNLPNPSEAPVVVAGQNTVAVEVHQQNAGSSDLSFDMMIWGSTIGNQPPSVTLTNPVPGSNLMVGTFVDVAATAADSDGTVARVDFFDNGVLRLSDNAAPFDFTLGDLTAGAHTISAVAFDNSGSNSTPSSVMIVVTNPPGLTAVLTNGAEWKYLDDGTDQGTAWKALLFTDTGWSNGIADFGYGDGPGVPERTVVGFGPDPNLKYTTTYFRKKINVASLADIGRLRLDALRDDGIVVHINGTEVFRNNFTNTTTPILFGDFADAAIGGAAESTYITYETNIAASGLIVGMNIIAVEIHQSDTNSSDISFDLMLWGTGPELTITKAGANYTVRWNNAPNYRLQQSANISSSANWADVAGDPPSPYTQPLPAAPSQRFFRLRHR